MNLIRTRISCGLPAPVKILQITDVHLTYADASDTAEHHKLMAERREVFRREGGYPPKTPEEYLCEAIALAEREKALLVCTGDAIDIHTHGNLSALMRLLTGVDLMFSPGGHEHQRICLRTMEEPYPYWETVRPRLEAELARFDLYAESRIVGGLNVMTLDNSLDYYPRRTLKALRREIDKGLPILAFSHDPIWDSLLSLTEPSHPNVRLTPEDYRQSHEVIDLLLNHPLVIGTVSGHGHKNEERRIGEKTHYMTDGLFKGTARLITVE